MIVPGRPLQPRLMFVGKVRVLLKSGAPKRFFTLALCANIVLGWKGLPGTNTLAYYGHSYISDMKSFITLVPGPNVKKLFCP